MQRRDFVRASLAVAGTATLGASTAGVLAPEAEAAASAQHTFKLKYAPHFGMFEHHAGEDLLDQLRFMADVGFTALEDNGMKGRTVETQEAVAREMGRLGMDMGVFVAHSISWNEPHLVSRDESIRDQFLKEIRESVEVAKRVNAKWMTIVPGHIDLGMEMDYQTANVIESLKRAADILEPHGLVIVMEPLNWWTNHPGQFLTKVPQAYMIAKAVGSPSVKILFDMYHQQITEGNIIPNIDYAWDEVGYFQIGDNPGRKEPTTGEINYKNIFQHIHQKNWTGILGMEHGNSKPGKEGEQALIDAYAQVDDFLV